MHHNEARYLDKISALRNDYLPSAYKILAGVVVVLVILVAALLWFTPWVQTAYGTGQVDSLDPAQRTQAISALVSGQIKQWHVNEGELVEQGQPIVTLIDVDEELVSKLQAQLDAAQAVHAANQSAVANARNNLNRQQTLLEQGVASDKTVEAAQIKLQELVAKAAKSQSDINKASVSLSRQRTQTKVAPSDGVVIKLKSGGPSTYVKAGEVLGEFIPEGVQRHVRVTVSGMDAPLIEVGRKARLQFEGWPVFQFSGWPEAAIGTFGGEVIYVEPVADNIGNFNVWIAPDPEGQPWPQEQVVRFGSRVKAWVLLEEVRLGYELWRQLNNFPPKPVVLDNKMKAEK
ncbi:efflux RND transporter periplasmic adaptor subunit [Salinimonas chungwhensis]|uniref:efflux RND transporter periplasmic adaptor subunit n=1 Tax=Salinimonas chungwhensis TaxID=265425 RepID=UPI000365D5A5|nr:HlyD family efflux transporter periplasmic adaptor subunit [Salinimonas chungwhensis]